MAGKSTISITFKLDGDGKGFKELSADADGLKKVISSAVSEAQQLNSEAINFAAIASSLDAMQRSFQELLNGMQDLADAYAVQEVAETKLAVIMQQRMNATQAEIQSIKDLTSAQQELGVIGDEVQLSGAQQIATFLTEAESLETLIPAMNNLLAQQKGLNASTQDAVSIANLMGKVMQGQVSSLREVGISFSEAEERALKYGTETERAAMLAQIITNNVGEMNAALAQTDSGKQQQLNNTLGDMKETLGGMVNAALPFVTIAAHSLTALTNITTLATGVKKASAAIAAFNIKGKAMAVAVRLMGVDAARTATVMRVFTAATHSGAYAVTALKLAIKGLMITTGIGIAIAALTTVIEKLTAATETAADKEAQLAEELKEFKRELRDIGEAAAAEAQKEVTAIDKLVAVAKDETKARADRAAAIRELQDKYPAYFSNIDAERIKINDLTTGYDNLRNAIIQSARAKAAQQKIEENTGKLIDKELEIADKEQEIQGYTDDYNAAVSRRDAGLESGRAERSGDSFGDYLMQALAGGEKVQPISSGDMQAVTATADMEKYAGKIEQGNAELQQLRGEVQEITAANEYLADIIANTPAIEVGSNETPGAASPKWKEDAATLREIGDNIQILNDLLQNATVEEAALINQQIASWNAKADAIKNAGKVKADNTPLWKEDAATLQDINNNIAILTQRLQTATVEEAALINQQIASWNAKAEAITNAGKVATTTSAVWKEDAATLKDINGNIQILESQLEAATLSEAALINQQIELWNKKADAIRNAGKEAEKTSITTGEGLRKSWGAVKNIGSSVENITEALKGNGNAWQAVVGIVDGFLGLYDGFQTVIQVISALTGVTNMLTAAKQGEAAATATATTAAVTGAAQEIAASTANTAVKSAETTANVSAAASGALAAHAAIPFVGIALGLAAVAAIVAAMKSIPKFADGGIVSGPTLAMVGEYAGASGNPEVIAPLDKLRSMLAPAQGYGSGDVNFRIKGRELVGIIEKENNIKRRG